MLLTLQLHAPKRKIDQSEEEKQQWQQKPVDRSSNIQLTKNYHGQAKKMS